MRLFVSEHVAMDLTVEFAPMEVRKFEEHIQIECDNGDVCIIYLIIRLMSTDKYVQVNWGGCQR